MSPGKSSKRDRFMATVRVVVLTDVPLRAKTFEDAIVEARELREKDVVEFSTDFIDGKIEVESIRNDNTKWPMSEG